MQDFQVRGCAWELGRLDAFWGISSRGLWSAGDQSPHLATCAVRRLENTNTQHSMIWLYFISGNWNSISRLPWTCWRSHWLCRFCSCSRSWAVCRGRVPAWLTVAAGSTTAGNRSWLCCGSILGFPKDSLEQQAIRCPSEQLTQHTLAVARSQMSLFFLMKSDNSEVVVLLLYQGLGGTCISLFSVTWGFFACFAEDTTARVWNLYQKKCNMILK